MNKTETKRKGGRKKDGEEIRRTRKEGIQYEMRAGRVREKERRR